MRSRLPILLFLLAGCGPPVSAKVLLPVLEVGYPGLHGEPPKVPFTIDFGPLQTGVGYVENLRIANVGNAVLRVDPIDVDINSFEVHSEARSLRPSEQMVVNVKFQPTKAGKFDHRFVVTSSDSATSAGAVHLVGESFDCGPLNQILPLDFGWVKPDGQTTEHPWQVNFTFVSGQSPAGCVASYALEQPPGGPFKLVGVTPYSDDHEVQLVEPGPLNVTVDFTPTDYLPAQGSVVFRYADNSIAAAIPVTGNDGMPARQQVTEIVPTQPDLSVLAVIDSSPLMAGLESWVLEHVRAAAQEEAGVRHVRVGVTSTGVGPDPSCTDAIEGSADGRLLPIPASIRIFPIPTREDLLESAAAVGACHANPSGLEAMVLALSPALLGTADDPNHPEPDDGNLGLLPDGSDLRVVLISASEDQSPGQPGDFAGFIRQLRGDRRVSVRAVLGGVSCRDHGQRYDDFASGLGGEVEDLCAPSPHDLSDSIPNYVIPLSRVVLDRTKVTVTVDGMPLTRGQDFTVTDRTGSPGLSQVEIIRQITEPDGLWSPLPGAEIVVTYDAPAI